MFIFLTEAARKFWNMFIRCHPIFSIPHCSISQLLECQQLDFLFLDLPFLSSGSSSRVPHFLDFTIHNIGFGIRSPFDEFHQHINNWSVTLSRSALKLLLGDRIKAMHLSKFFGILWKSQVKNFWRSKIVRKL